MPGTRPPGPEDPPRPKKDDDDDDLGSGKKISNAADRLADQFEDFIEIVEDERQDLEEAYKTLEDIGKSLRNSPRYDHGAGGELTNPYPPPSPAYMDQPAGPDDELDMQSLGETIDAAVRGAIDRMELREEDDTKSIRIRELESELDAIDGLDGSGEKPPTEETEVVETQPASDGKYDLLELLPWAIIVGGGGLYVVRKK